MNGHHEKVEIELDGRRVEVSAGSLVIEAAHDVGTYIPRFCWHPRMNPVGMCRMCLVEVETPRGPMLVTACTNRVNQGMKIDTKNDTVKKAQEGVLEFLLANHPLDCPVCDKGGECPLQDQAFAYGPGESRFVEEKRHYEKPIPISDLVLLDRERCILCARCTRFSDEISGDPLIEFQDRGNHTQVNTFPDLPFSSYFSGNTVQICPVGALTASTYRFRARPWDLHAVESTCMHCSSGDRVVVQSSQNEILRVLGVDSEHPNHGWLSDKCRFGFEYLNAEERLSTPLIKDETGEFREASWAEALDLVASRLAAIVSEHGGQAVAALGGARSTNEDAYALSKFMRTAVGSNNVDAQMDDGLNPRFLVAGAGRGRIGDLEHAKAVLVWGPDLKEEHPTLYLRVRRAAQERGATLIVVHPRRTGLDDRADHVFRYVPGHGDEVLAGLRDGTPGFHVAHEALRTGPVVALVGRTGYGEDARLAESVAAFVRDLPVDASILPLERRANVFGALDMGLSPTLLPGRASVTGTELDEAWGDIPRTPGRGCRRILEGLVDEEVRGLVLMGADPVRDVPDGALARRAIEAAGFVVALDLFLTDSSRLADVVLPVEGFAEKDGTVTNLEGRVQKVNNVVPGPGQSRPDWSVLEDLAVRMGSPLGFSSVEGIAKEIAEVAPAYGGITWDLLEWDERDGAVAPYGEASQPLSYVPAATATDSDTVGLVLHSARTLYDDGVLMRHGPSLHRLAHGGFVALHPDDAAEIGVGEGDTATVRTAAGEAALGVVIDEDMAQGVVYVPFNQPGVPSLGSHLAVEVEPA